MSSHPEQAESENLPGIVGATNDGKEPHGGKPPTPRSPVPRTPFHEHNTHRIVPNNGRVVPTNLDDHGPTEGKVREWPGCESGNNKYVPCGKE